MGTVPEPEAPEETPAQVFIHRAETAARTLIAGHEVGSVRRIALYAIVAAALFGAGPLGAVGMVALVLLVATDVLR